LGLGRVRASMLTFCATKPAESSSSRAPGQLRTFSLMAGLSTL